MSAWRERQEVPTKKRGYKKHFRYGESNPGLLGESEVASSKTMVPSESGSGELGTWENKKVIVTKGIQWSESSILFTIRQMDWDGETSKCDGAWLPHPRRKRASQCRSLCGPTGLEARGDWMEAPDVVNTRGRLLMNLMNTTIGGPHRGYCQRCTDIVDDSARDARDDTNPMRHGLAIQGFKLQDVKGLDLTGKGRYQSRLLSITNRQVAAPVTAAGSLCPIGWKSRRGAMPVEEVAWIKRAMKPKPKQRDSGRVISESENRSLRWRSRSRSRAIDAVATATGASDFEALHSGEHQVAFNLRDNGRTPLPDWPSTGQIPLTPLYGIPPVMEGACRVGKCAWRRRGHHAWGSLRTAWVHH
ncbi:hypothetical protein BJY52DRAFT_1223904 [Lactarius psammicola]|nr:hypothetical protein BJY52DRAFT_1223904 [Lactarius psammicola]